MRLKRIAVDHIHRTVKQTGDIIFHTGVIENGDVGLGREFHQNIKVAVRPVVAARHGAKHRRMADAARTQGALVAL